MICPECHEDVPSSCSQCPACGATLSPELDRADGAEFIFCEGCGARLGSQERTCPKCGRPAPGILSTRSASSDLAAGKTASFPRLSSEAIASSVPAPAPAPVWDDAADPDATSILNVDGLPRQDSASADRARSLVDRAPVPAIDPDAPDEAYRRPSKRRRVLAVLAGVLIVGAVGFVALDPLGVMPGLLERFEDSASAMFPSRQVAEEPADDGAASAPVPVDQTIDDATAYTRLSAIYGDIVAFQGDLGPVIDDFNSWYVAADLAQRQDGSRSAYALRDEIQTVIDELDGMKIAADSVYTEDVEHLRQLATWMFNRVDVLCRSWDVSLGLPEGERPMDHQDEILAPLREVEMIDGKAVDVIEYERNVGAWKPQEK